MAGTGDQESPCERRPLAFPPRPAHLDQVATLLPQGALEDSAADGRAPEAGTAATRDFTPPSWEPAARYSQQCTSCFKKSERVCWPRGTRSSRPASERASGWASKGAAACITGHLARDGPARGPRGPHHPARFPGPGLPLPAAAPVQRSSPSCRAHLPAADSTTLQAPSGWAARTQSSLPSCLTSRSSLRLPREESPPGRYTGKTRALPGERRLQVCKSGKLAARSQHSQQGASGWEITCLVLTQKEKRAHSCRSRAVTESGWGCGAPRKYAEFLLGSPWRPRMSVHLPDTRPQPPQHNRKLLFQMISNHRKVLKF